MVYPVSTSGLSYGLSGVSVSPPSMVEVYRLGGGGGWDRTEVSMMVVQVTLDVRSMCHLERVRRTYAGPEDSAEVDKECDLSPRLLRSIHLTMI